MVKLETPPATPKQSLALVYGDIPQTPLQRLMQPLNIAIITSAVLHGVVGYAAPSLTFLRQPTLPKEVKIMQLTPQEQSRIRRDVQPLPPAVRGVPIPNTPTQGTNINPGFPNNNFSNNLGAPVYNYPQVSGYSPYIPDSNSIFIPANPRQSSAGGFGNQQFTRIPNETGGNTGAATRIPQPSPAPSIPVRRWDQYTQAPNLSVAGRPVFGNAVGRTSPSPTPSIAVSPSPTPSSSPTIATSPAPSQNNDGSSGNGVVATNPTPPPTTSSNGASNSNSGNGSSNANNGNGSSDGQPGVLNPSQLLAFNPTNTDLTQDGLSSNFVSFLGVGNDDFLKQEQQVKLTLDRVPYPTAACVPQLRGTAILGVITDRTGAISKGPEILQSSGYGIFNQAAIAAAKTYANFTPTKVYIITVPFVYSAEVCSGVGEAPRPEQVTQNPSPTPSISPTPANPAP